MFTSYNAKIAAAFVKTQSLTTAQSVATLLGCVYQAVVNNRCMYWVLSFQFYPEPNHVMHNIDADKKRI